MIVSLSKEDIVVTGLYQYDCGRFMEFTDFVIPDGTEIHYFQGEFSCKEVVDQQTVKIPDYLLSLDKNILAYMYIKDGNERKTIKRFTILVHPREKPPDYIDPSKPADYSRLLPIGGEIGDSLIRTADGYAWKNYDNMFASDEELRKVSESIPIAMTAAEILEICK